MDQTRARLLSQGYPKSGFTYDMYRDNAGLMTTESDKKQYTLYDLQDRLGAQIRLFEGVRDAKVTIAEAGEQKYAISDQTGTDASASVVVTMESGKALTPDKAAAIKNLIARAVKGMNFTSVSVFDAETMMAVSYTHLLALGFCKKPLFSRFCKEFLGVHSIAVIRYRDHYLAAGVGSAENDLSLG